MVPIARPFHSVFLKVECDEVENGKESERSMKGFCYKYFVNRDREGEGEDGKRRRVGDS